MAVRPVELFFDPICPYAWMTSRWLLHAAEVREIAPTFSVMSLAMLNEGRDLDPDYRRSMDDAWGPARVAIEVDCSAGKDKLLEFYTAFGERFHVGGSEDRRACAVAALEEAGLPAELIDVYDTDRVDAPLRSSHQRAIDMVGDEVGTPVVSFGGGTAYFGPVISPAPRGEEAGVLFDGLEALTRVHGFFEIKRSRTGGVDLS